MKKNLPVFTLLPLLLLGGCSNNQVEKIPLLFGRMHGEVETWNALSRDLDETYDWDGYELLTRIDYSTLAGLVKNKENFVLVAKGNDGSCSCYQSFHRALGMCVVAHNLNVYVIEVEDLAKGADYFGLSCALSVDELAIFKEGKIAYLKDDKEWGKKHSEVSEYLNEHLTYPKIFYVDQSQLDDLYDGNEAFFIYFKRGECGDCQYIEKTSLKDYMFSDKKVEPYTFAIDIDPWRNIIDEQGVSHSMKDTTAYDENMTWGEYVSQSYAEKKAEYGLADPESGYSTGVVPTFFRIIPDGEGTKTGSVIKMAGVFYNDSVKDDKISATYFTKERLENESLDYLKNSSLTDKVLLDKPLKEGTSEAMKNFDMETVHEAFRVYHEPIFNALLDASIAL